jgi:hypothetical protein
MAKEYVRRKEPCQEERHSRHLCVLADDFFHVLNAEAYRAMVKDSKFKCEFCGRTAESRDNLCYPVGL